MCRENLEWRKTRNESHEIYADRKISEVEP